MENYKLWSLQSTTDYYHCFHIIAYRKQLGTMPAGRWQQSGLILQTGLQRRQSGGLLNQTSLAGDLTRNKVHLIPQEQAVKVKWLISSETCLLDTFIKHPFCIFAPVIPVNFILKNYYM